MQEKVRQGRRSPLGQTDLGAVSPRLEGRGVNGHLARWTGGGTE